jgi:glycosyltransferase involved in cell wall biosynthesis
VARAPDVTVVIPTRNRWDLLSTAALPSALGQEDVDVEVLVIDDGSTDGTAAGVAALGDPRARLIRREPPHGVARARNAGIAAAGGAWIALLDDDDLWSPRKLRTQLDAAEAAGASFAYGAAAALAEDRAWVYSLASPDPETLTSTLLARNVLWGGCSNVVVRSDAVRQLEGFDERLFQLADWDLWIRLSQSARAAACPELLVACIEHRRSMLLTTDEDIFAELEYVERKHRSARESAGVNLDRRTFTRWVALGHRRAGRRLRASRLYLTAAIRDRDAGSLVRGLAAPFGERPVGWARDPARRRVSDETGELSREPPWLARYR